MKIYILHDGAVKTTATDLTDSQFIKLCEQNPDLSYMFNSLEELADAWNGDDIITPFNSYMRVIPDDMRFVVTTDIHTDSQTDGTYCQLFSSKADAMAFVTEQGERFAALSEHGGWECHEEWDGLYKKEFEYYTDNGNKYISCKFATLTK